MTEFGFQPVIETVERLPIKRSRPFASEVRRWLVVGTVFSILAVGLLSASLIAAIYMSARTDQERPVDAIVVMGAAQFNGRPSAVLEARLETAYRVWSDGVAPLIIVTGGKMPGDNFTESEASRDYLVERGVPETAILLENEGRNSADSLTGVAQIAEARNVHSVLIVSDGFHLFRSRMIAEDNGLVAFGVPAENSPIEPWSSTELDYVLREAAAVLAYVFR